MDTSDITLKDTYGNIGVQWMKHWDVLSFLIIASAKLLYYGKQISPDYFDAKLLQQPVIASVLAISAIAYLFKEKGRIMFLYAVNVAISLILIADTTYFRYYQNVITIAAIEKWIPLKDLLENIFVLIKATDIVYFIDLFFSILLIKMMKRVHRNPLNIRMRLVIFSVIFSLGITLDVQFIYKYYRSQPKVSSPISNELYLTKSLGSINFHILDIYNVVVYKINSMTNHQ